LQSTKFINTLAGEKKYLIDYANLKQNLLPFQSSFLNKKQLYNFFKKKYFGIPALFPLNLKVFDYSGSIKYVVDKNFLLKNIYHTKNAKYKPYISYIKFGNQFSTFVKPKKKYLNLVKKIIAFNRYSISEIKKIKKKFKNICSFQTRNIPHHGHEKILDYLLSKYDHVVINPLIGPKKKGDIKFDILAEIYKFLLKEKYKKKVSYIPFVANMFYAGPQEAVHHANLRYSLGFNNFVVGRDHAGSENLYKPHRAYNYISKMQNHLKIKVEKVLGSYFCKKCDNVVIKNSCSHKSLINISGTEFRNCLKDKRYFKYADYKLQNFIFGIKEKIFVD
jgi:sulfate adenylyltransferase